MKTMVILSTVNTNSDVNTAFNEIENYVGLRNIKTDTIENMPFVKGVGIKHEVDYNLAIDICEICEKHSILPIFIDIDNVDAISNLEMLRFKL